MANHGDHFRDIRLSTAGIVFLGTPHQGSDAAKYGIWLARAGGHHRNLLTNLKRNSPILYQISQDFDSSYRDADIVFFYEDEDGYASTKVCLCRALYK